MTIIPLAAARAQVYSQACEFYQFVMIQPEQLVGSAAVT